MATRSKNAHCRFDTIHTRHWHQLDMKNGGAVVWGATEGLVEQIEKALLAVEARLPRDFHSMSWEAISKGIRAEAERFQACVKEL